MGQRVITFLNHLDFKKNKNNNNANKKGRKKHTGDHFFSQRKKHTWGGTKKKIERDKEEEKIDSPVFLSQTEKQGTFEKEIIIFEERSQV